MTTYGLLMCLPMFALLVWAAVIDLAERRIPNWLSFGLLLSGLGQSFSTGGLSPGQSFLGFVASFGVLFVLFGIGALGGGDVKLMAGVGAWLGPLPALAVIVAAAVVGMVIVLGQAAHQGRLAALFRNSTLIAVNLAHANDTTSLAHAADVGKSSRSVDRPLPYAVPALIGAVIVVSLA
jgi:prepilin peptidase CpaA